MPNGKPKVKRKIRYYNLFILFIILGVFFGCFWYFYQLPIKNIIITGTTFIKDHEIIEVTGIKNYPPIFHLNIKELKNNIKSLDYVKEVKIKRNFFGQITISIVEDVPLFYNRDQEKLILSSGKEVVTQKLYGVPILVNYVPDEIYQRLLKEMNLTNLDVLKLISEIIYQPWKGEDGTMIDDTRFFLRMNDGNVVYVNLINFEKLNNYMTIYSTLGEAKGTLQLDSSLGNGITFAPF